MLEVEQLSTYYPILPVIETKEMNKGNTSNATLNVTMDGKYILRKLMNQEQAMTEFIISKALSKQNISPTILLNNNNIPYIEDKEDIYNLQIYIESHLIDRNKEINFYTLGKTISLFHSKIKDVEGIYEQYDRFSLREMWKQLIEVNGFNKFNYKTQLSTLLELCLNYNHRKNCYIHGDLGIWNLLFNQGEVYIIDYGEVRKGNNLFDVSAVISSTIDWNKGEDAIITSLTDFRNGYISNFDSFNWKVLTENVTLWYTRGMVALLINQGINDLTSEYINESIERMKKLNGIIETYFI